MEGRRKEVGAKDGIGGAVQMTRTVTSLYLAHYLQKEFLNSGAREEEEEEEKRYEEGVRLKTNDSHWWKSMDRIKSVTT